MWGDRDLWPGWKETVPSVKRKKLPLYFQKQLTQRNSSLRPEERTFFSPSSAPAPCLFLVSGLTPLIFLCLSTTSQTCCFSELSCPRKDAPSTRTGTNKKGGDGSAQQHGRRKSGMAGAPQPQGCGIAATCPPSGSHTLNSQRVRREGIIA